jgi:putative membrane protein insertion efficiency factor
VIGRLLDLTARLATAALAVPIRAYRRLISPVLPRRCKYEPTCSAYALEALRVHGPLRGSALAAWRVLRCNPLSHGGHDPVPGSTRRDGIEATEAGAR